jgi:hypothetical protein
MSPNTEIIGVSVGGNSLAQPASANAFIVNTLSQTFGYKWTIGFASFDGCANNALSVGASAATGSNIASQNVLFSWFDGSGVKQNLVLQASGGFLQLFAAHLTISAGSLFLPTGQGVLVNGNTIITDRRTGWTAAVGTAYRASFDADYTQAIGAAYSQAQVQAIQDLLTPTRHRLMALEADCRAHGLIN